MLASSRIVSVIFSCFTAECLVRYTFRDYDKMKEATKDWIDFYKNARPHSSLNLENSKKAYSQKNQ